MRVLIDMNLSPEWVSSLSAAGHTAVHWTSVGDARASDQAIADWALDNDFVVFTHDLDFGTLVTLTHRGGPSVIQVRSANVLPEFLAPRVLAALKRYESELAAGAIVVVDERRSRVRILPLGD